MIYSIFKKQQKRKGGDIRGMSGYCSANPKKDGGKNSPESTDIRFLNDLGYTMRETGVMV